MKRKVAILIRVYDRIEDLKYNLEIIHNTWSLSDYYVIVVSNGYPKGFIIDDSSEKYINKLVVLDQNAGHKKGNSQLLLEGIKYIPDECRYTIILEADTWIYTDNVLVKYMNLMDNQSDVVWYSADWYDKDYALATDIAIIRTDYIKKNPALFDFELYPESHIANYLHDHEGKFEWITENMPVHIPSYVPKYPYIHDISNKRFYVFPKSKMVTHHIEFLKDGMDEKKRYFNIIVGFDYFKDQPVHNKKWELLKIKSWINLSHLFLKKSWFKKKTYREIKD